MSPRGAFVLMTYARLPEDVAALELLESVQTPTAADKVGLDRLDPFPSRDLVAVELEVPPPRGERLEDDLAVRREIRHWIPF